MYQKGTHKRFSLIFFLLFIISLIFLYSNRCPQYNSYQRIIFSSAGSSLAANLYHPTKDFDFQEKHPLIIYCHGLGSQRDLDLRIPIELIKRGFFVASLDYQGHGESGGYISKVDEDTGILALAQDCSRLLDVIEKMEIYENEINPDQVGLIGHSLGGLVVLMNAALDQRFKATVTWAGAVDINAVILDLPNAEIFNEYSPLKLMTPSKPQNLLMFHHVDDEILDYETHALAAQEKTHCNLITLENPLPGGGHALLSNMVIIKTINWYEGLFFNSEEINGPISPSYMINYLLLSFSVFSLLAFSLSLMLLLSDYFNLKEPDNHLDSEKKIASNSRDHENGQKRIQITKLILYYALYISGYIISITLFELMGVLVWSFMFIIIYLAIKFGKYSIGPKRFVEEYDLKEAIYDQFNSSILNYSLLCSAIFLGFYLIFAVSYPFAFFLPNSIDKFFLGLIAYPIYLSLELFYRKVLGPLMDFISVALKNEVIISLGVINILILVQLTNKYNLPALLFTYLILLFVLIKNTLVFEKTEKFISVIITSFIIIQVFFSAAISTFLGVGISIIDSLAHL